MNFRENKLEIGVMMLAVVMTGGMMRLFGFFTESTPQEEPEISYEMPRPKDDIAGEFGLNGREIDRRYINPFGAAKKIEAKKDMKPAKVAAAPKKDEKKGAQSEGGLFLRKKAASFNVVEKDKSGLGENPFEGKAPNPEANNSNRHAPTADTQENKDDVLSPAQWRALVLGQPTKENVNKMVDALQAGKTDEATFDAVMTDLLKSQKKDEQALALYGLGRVPTAKSFAVVAKEYDGLSADIKPAAQQFLTSYSKVEKRGALKQSLQSSDSTVAYKAAQVVLNSLQNGGTISTDPRQARGQTTTTANSYSGFASIFQGWASSSNPTLQGIASQILPLLSTNQA